MNLSTDGRNPLLPPHMHIADPEARVMPDGRVYVYGSWDRYDDCYCSDQYRVVSSDDLIHWRDHGVSFDVESVPWTDTPDARRWPGFDWTKPTPFLQQILDRLSTEPARPPSGPVPKDLLWAPDAIHRDGRY